MIKNDDNKNLIFKNTVSFRERTGVGSQPSPPNSKPTLQTQNPAGPRGLPSSQRPAVATACAAPRGRRSRRGYAGLRGCVRAGWRPPRTGPLFMAPPFSKIINQRLLRIYILKTQTAIGGLSSPVGPCPHPAGSHFVTCRALEELEFVTPALNSRSHLPRKLSDSQRAFSS